MNNLSYSKYFFFGKIFLFLNREGREQQTRMVELSTILAQVIKGIIQYLIQFIITGIGVFVSVLMFLYTLMYLVIFFRVIVPEIRYRLMRMTCFMILLFYIHLEPLITFITNLIADYYVVALLFISY